MLRPFPAARELITQLKNQGLKVGIATSADLQELKQCLSVTGIENLVDFTTSADDAARSKTNAYILEAALKNRMLAN